MMLRNRTTLTTLALGIMAFAITGCEEDAPVVTPSERTSLGTTSTIAGGTVRSFMKIDAQGNPTELGLKISARTVDSIPLTGTGVPTEFMYDIAVPAEAGLTAIDHISFDWNPQGHPPFAIYGPGHFDMHFYTQPKTARMTWIDTAKLNVIPASGLVPTGLMTDGVGIPTMGLHYVDSSSHEFHGQPFTSTFIWGYYNGEQAFIEPMITRSFLQGKTTFSGAIKQPAQYSRPGKYYPTTYSIRYDAATSEHIVTMSGMVKR